MFELQTEQQVRLECLIAAADHYNTLLDNGIEPMIGYGIFEIAESFYKYIMDKEIPKPNATLN